MDELEEIGPGIAFDVELDARFHRREVIAIELLPHAIFKCEFLCLTVKQVALAGLGVDKPVIPGIMPVTNVAQIERFAALSGAEVPAGLRARLHAAADDPAEVRRIGVAAATELCAELLAAGAPGLHFYTLNRSTATREIWAALGLPVAAAA